MIQGYLNCGFRTADLGILVFIFQSAFRNLQSAILGARLILRKPRWTSGSNSFPADAFSAPSRSERDFRAITWLSRKKDKSKSEWGQD
jgi:hypothetical protein